LKTKKLRVVVQKAQNLLAAPTGGCKRMRLKRRGGQKVSAKSAKARALNYPGGGVRCGSLGGGMEEPKKAHANDSEGWILEGGGMG